ncbi:hypothetical protein V6N11_084360 [Hibiscus sabdariffa]|uniref:Uncharacterized protein n=1 Tax=Hibiscus sabdariffa TaxID=183260 RepID=A0ABR2QSY1_9ROSI
MPWHENLYSCDDQGDLCDDYSFDATTHMPWHENFHFTEDIKARMDAQHQEIEEISRKIEYHMKLISNLNSELRQLVQGDSKIPNQEGDGQITQNLIKNETHAKQPIIFQEEESLPACEPKKVEKEEIEVDDAIPLSDT